MVVLVALASPAKAANVNDTQLDILRAVASDWWYLVRIPDHRAWNDGNLENACTYGRALGIEECDDEGWVTRMRLDSVGLGVMSPAFANMSRLQSLSIRNSLSGALDPTWGQLTLLQNLTLDFNEGLNGSIPDAWQGLVSLEHLIIRSSNHLVTSIPTWINTAWPQLRTLSLESVGLCGAIPDSLGQHPALSHLQLNANRLNGTLPATFATNSLLEHINLERNQLEGELPKVWGAASELRSLKLAHNSFTGSVPSHLPGVLTFLDISYNALSGSIPSTFFDTAAGLTDVFLASNSLSGSATLPSNPINSALKSYLIFDNDISGALDPSIWTHSKLETFWAQNNAIEGPLPVTFNAGCRLQDIQLSGNLITGSISSDIDNCLDLHRLVLDQNEISGDLPSDLDSLATLGEVNLSHNNISGVLDMDWSHLDTLYHLDLSHNRLAGGVPIELLDLTHVSLVDLFINNNQLSLCQNENLMTNSTISEAVLCRAELQDPIECGCPSLWIQCFEMADMEDTCDNVSPDGTVTPDEPHPASPAIQPTSSASPSEEPTGTASKSCLSLVLALIAILAHVSM